MIPAAYLLPALVFVAVMAIGAGLLLARAMRSEESVRSRLVTEQEREAEGGVEQGPILLRMTSAFGHLFGVSQTSANLRKFLARAGYHGDSAVAAYLGSKMILLIFTIALLGILSVPLPWSNSVKILAVLACGTLMFLVPNFIVRLRGSHREQQIRRYLPDAVDLLEICVSGGMGLDQAWNVVTEEISSLSMLLGDEMAYTNLEIHLGASRSLAMRHMGERTGCQEAASLAAALTQSEQFGTSIGETLRIFAGSMRESRSHQAAESAEKMAVKLLFPLIFLIFPAIFVVVVGPASIQLVKIMGAK